MTRIAKKGRRSFLSDVRGNVAIVFSLTAPLLAGAGGAAIDYSLAVTQKASLQSAADSAAIAAARELAFVGTYSDRIAGVARAVALANLESDAEAGPPEIVASPTDDGGVKVDISQPTVTYFSRLVPAAPDEVSATATATTLGEKVCVIGLEESAADGIRLEGDAVLSAGDCAVHANSTNPGAIRAEGTSRLIASTICSSGGYRGLDANYRPVPLTDCPQVEDPMAQRPQPKVGGCTAKRKEIRGTGETLNPGTYCGGLLIHDKARVFLSPGIYVIKDGPLKVDSGAELVGEYVGFFFTGPNAVMRLTGDAVIDIGAPKDGPMAGVLFWEDRNSQGLRQFRIDTDFAHTLLGTIYLPQGRFVVDADQPVAEQSAYTALVVKRLELSEAPKLVLNTDYDQTDVPVPEGVGPTGATRLVR